MSTHHTGRSLSLPRPYDLVVKYVFGYSRWRRSGRVQAAVLLALVVPASTPLYGRVEAPAFEVHISPDSGPPGTTVAISGRVLDPYNCPNTVSFTWKGPDLPKNLPSVITAPEAESGDYATTIRVPRVHRGPISLEAGCGVDEPTWFAPSTQFDVTETPTLTITPVSGPAGTTVTVDGEHFDCGSATANVYWQNDRSHRVKAHADGGFSADILAPASLALGNQQLIGECDGVTASATFGLTGASTPPSTGPPSQQVPASPTPSVVTAVPAPGRARADPPVTSVTTAPPTAGSGGAPSMGFGAGTVGGATGMGDPVHPIRLSALVPTPDHFSLSLLQIVLVAALAALIVLLVAFPAELFNRTYETNEGEIHRVWRRLGVPQWRPSPMVGFAAFVGFGAVLGLLLASGEGAAGNPMAQLVSVLVAVPLVMLTYALPTELYARGHSPLRAVLRVLPTAILITAVCGVLSFVLKLNPPYLYGLFAGFALAAGFHRRLDVRQEGRAVLLGAGCLGGLVVIAAALRSMVYPQAHGEHSTWLTVLLDAVLFWIVVLGAESLVLALAPLRCLDGARLREWRLAAWLIPQVLAALFFAYVLVLRGGLKAPQDSIVDMCKTLGFFVLFGVASLAFWRYFFWPGRPTARYAPVFGDPSPSAAAVHLPSPTASPDMPMRAPEHDTDTEPR